MPRRFWSQLFSQSSKYVHPSRTIPEAFIVVVGIADEDVVFVAGYLGHDRSPFQVFAWIVMSNQAFNNLE